MSQIDDLIVKATHELQSRVNDAKETAFAVDTHLQTLLDLIQGKIGAHKAELAKVKQQHQAELVKLKQEHKAKLIHNKQQVKQHEAELVKLKQEHKDELTHNKAEHEQQVQTHTERKLEDLFKQAWKVMKNQQQPDSSPSPAKSEPPPSPLAESKSQESGHTEFISKGHIERYIRLLQDQYGNYCTGDISDIDISAIYQIYLEFVHETQDKFIVAKDINDKDIILAVRELMDELHQNCEKEIWKIVTTNNCEIFEVSGLIHVLAEGALKKHVKDWCAENKNSDPTPQEFAKVLSSARDKFARSKAYISMDHIKKAFESCKAESNKTHQPEPQEYQGRGTRLVRVLPGGCYPLNGPPSELPESENEASEARSIQPGDNVVLRENVYLLNNKGMPQNAGTFARVSKIKNDESVWVQFLNPQRKVNDCLQPELIKVTLVKVLNKDFTTETCPYDPECEAWNSSLATSQGYKTHATKVHEFSKEEITKSTLYRDDEVEPAAAADVDDKLVVHISEEDEPVAKRQKGEPAEPAAEPAKPAAEPDTWIAQLMQSDGDEADEEEFGEEESV
jgi:hypothetical protein